MNVRKAVTLLSFLCILAFCSVHTTGEGLQSGNPDHATYPGSIACLNLLWAPLFFASFGIKIASFWRRFESKMPLVVAVIWIVLLAVTLFAALSALANGGIGRSGTIHLIENLGLQGLLLFGFFLGWPAIDLWIYFSDRGRV